MDDFTKWLNTGGGAILWQEYNRKVQHAHAFSGRPGGVQTCSGCGFKWEVSV